MKMIPWEQRQPGDILFVRLQNLVGNLIVDFVTEIHADYKGGFIPTHAAVLASDDMVIESSMSWHDDSVAAINPASEYVKLPAQLWRIERSEEQIVEALDTFAVQYAKEGYGFLNLLGFALQAAMKHFGNPKARNPILLSYVCSQAVMLFLRYPAAENWPLIADLHDCDPLALLMMCEANKTE